jgi:hypothetical protein
MGVDFVNDKDNDFRINWTGWNGVYQLALAEGWIPAGTKLDAPGRSSEYGANDGQYVTPEDALAMAEALEKAIDPEWLETVKEFIAFAKEGGFCIY